MARIFNSLNENDSPELRKKLGLPVYKEIRYMKKADHKSWEEILVTAFEIVDTYMPSGTNSLLITLENGEQVRILQDYFAEMNKPSFVEDMKKEMSEN